MVNINAGGAPKRNGNGAVCADNSELPANSRIEPSPDDVCKLRDWNRLWERADLQTRMGSLLVCVCIRDELKLGPCRPHEREPERLIRPAYACWLRRREGCVCGQESERYCNSTVISTNTKGNTREDLPITIG